MYIILVTIAHCECPLSSARMEGSLKSKYPAKVTLPHDGIILGWRNTRDVVQSRQITMLLISFVCHGVLSLNRSKRRLGKIINSEQRLRLPVP